MRSTRRCTTRIASWRRSCVAERVPELFGEYAAAYSRGERPQAREFLARAGAQVDELARLIDAFLARAPAPAPDEQAVELFEAGLLEPGRVDRRVWDVLAETLGAKVGDLLGWRPRLTGLAAPALARSSQPMMAVMRVPERSEEPEPEDDIDRLSVPTERR